MLNKILSRTNTLVFTTLCLILVSCESKSKKEKEHDPLPEIISIENEKVTKELSTNDNIKYYKGVKSLLRSYTLPKEERPELVNNPSARLASKYLYKIIDGTFSMDKIDPLDGLQLLNLPNDIKKTQVRLDQLSEHNYPTITENLYAISGLTNPPISDPGIEHFILLCLLDLSEWNEELMLYEAQQINIDQLPHNELKPIASYYKSTVLLQLGYPALAYQAAKKGEESISENISYSGRFNTELYGGRDEMDKLEQLKRTGKLLQAISLSEIKNDNVQKQGIDDLKKILTSIKSDKEVNEISLLTEAYLYSLKEDNNQKFLPLSNNDNLGFSERSTILRSLQAQQNPSKIRRLVSSIIISNHLFNYLKSTDFYSALLDSEKGKDVLSIFDRLNSAKNLPYVRDILKF